MTANNRTDSTFRVERDSLGPVKMLYDHHRKARNAQRPVKLELYDRSEEVRRDLDRAFPASHAIQAVNPSICLIGQSLDPSQVKQEHINPTIAEACLKFGHIYRRARGMYLSIT